MIGWIKPIRFIGDDSSPVEPEIFGPNVVENGDFATGTLDGWTNSSTGTGSVVAAPGSATLTGVNSSNRAILMKSVPTESGKSYAVKIVANVASGLFFAGHRSTSTFPPGITTQFFANTAVGREFPAGLGEYTVTMTATSSTTWLQFWTGTTATSAQLLEIEVREIFPQSVDLFFIMGQSNAEGRGAAADRVSVPLGRAWLSTNLTMRRLLDPVDIITGTYSSAWPAFGNRWYALTGRRAVVVELASGSSGLLPGVGTANWSSAGTLRGPAVTAANFATNSLSSSAFTIGSTFLLWQQGEQDAFSYNGDTVSQSTYQAEQEVLFDYFTANVAGLDGILVSELGQNSVYDPDYDLIRAAQNAAVASKANAHLAFTGAKDFPTEGKMMPDGVHYNQAGLAEMGEAFAEYAASLV